MDLYNVLGVDRKAEHDEIKRAWRIRAQAAHPDREGGDEARFKEVQLAYEVLSDPERRKKYDDTGLVEGEGTSIRVMAMQSISSLAVELSQVEGFAGNPLVELVNKMREIRDGHQRSVTQLEKRRAKLERFRGKFRLRKGKAGENLFDSAFGYAIKGVEDQIAQSRKMVECGDIALGILDDYECKAFGGQDLGIYDVNPDVFQSLFGPGNPFR